MAKQRVRVDLYYDGVWNELLKTDDSGESAALTRDPIEVTDGRGDEQGGPTPSTCSLTLDNLDGRFNPRNQASALFGKIGRNTPLRIIAGKPALVDTFTRTTVDGWTGTGALPWVHVGGTVPGDYDVNGSAGTHTHPAANVIHASHVDTGVPDHIVRALWDLSADDVTGAPVVVTVRGRVTDANNYYALNVEYSATTEQVVFSLVKRVAGVGSVLATFGTAINMSGIGTSDLIGELVVEGNRLAGKVWRRVGTDEPIGYQLYAEDDSLATGTLAGWGSLRAAGNTNAGLQFRLLEWSAEPGTIRFTGEAASWKPRRAIKGDASTLVEAAGVLRRLTQGEEPSLSPWRRSITAAPTLFLLLAYWPCEDDADSTAVASALGTGDSMTVTGTVAFAASGDTFRISASTTLAAGFGRSLDVGSGPLPNLAGGGKFVGVVPAGTSSPLRWSVAWVSRTNALQAGENITIARWFTPGGTYVRWDLVQKSSGLGYDLLAFTSVGGAGQVTLASSVNDQVTLTEYRVTAFQNGANTQVELYVAGNLEAANNYIGVTNARVSGVELNPDSNSVTGVSGFWVGHLQVWDSATPPGLGFSQVGQPTQVVDADGVKVYPWLGWLNERATDRLARHFREQGVPFRLIGARTDGVRMGPQPTQTFTGLLAEAEKTDVGVLADDRYAVGMTYRTRADVYEQLLPVLALDFETEDIVPPLDPDIDDLGVRNDIEAKRSNGSSARSTLETGPLSVQPPPAGVGRVSRPVDVNPAVDAALPSLATWYRMKGTLPGTRYSQVTVDLSEPAAALVAAPRVTPGDLLAIANIVDDQDAALHALGRVETIGSHTRRITFNAALAMSPLVVDTYSRVASNGWGSADTGQAWTVSGGAASDYSVNGSKGIVSAGTAAVLRHLTIPAGQPDMRVRGTINLDTGTVTGAPATVWLAGRVTDTANYYAAQVQFGTDDSVKLVIIRRVANALAGISSTVTISPGFGAGQQFVVELEVTGRTIRATAWAAAGAPAGWLLEVTDRSLAAGDGAGLFCRLEVGNTNPLPVRYEWDDVRVVHPQVLNGA